MAEGKCPRTRHFVIHTACTYYTILSSGLVAIVTSTHGNMSMLFVRLQVKNLTIKEPEGIHNFYSVTYDSCCQHAIASFTEYRETPLIWCRIVTHDYDTLNTYNRLVIFSVQCGTRRVTFPCTHLNKVVVLQLEQGMYKV